MKKMQKMQSDKKLVLGRESVRVLTTDDLKRIAGGQAEAGSNSMWCTTKYLSLQ